MSGAYVCPSWTGHFICLLGLNLFINDVLTFIVLLLLKPIKVSDYEKIKNHYN